MVPKLQADDAETVSDMITPANPDATGLTS